VVGAVAVGLVGQQGLGVFGVGSDASGVVVAVVSVQQGGAEVVK